MKLGNRQFSPSVGFTLLYLLTGACMIALGFWQLQRANEKMVMQQAADDAAARAPADIMQLDPDSPGAQFTRVELIGQFETARQFLWDNRVAGGRAGFEVVTPFRLKTRNALVLVNRGWVPLGQSRQSLPDVGFSAESATRLTGVFTRPSIGFSGGDAVDLASTDWPRLLQHFDYTQIATALGEPVMPGLVQALQANDTRGIALFQDNWAPVAFGPERHYGYAFQWFAMFVALSLIYIVLNTRKPVASNSS